MGLFSLYKPKEYKYRYIYYDPKKEARNEREKNQETDPKEDGTYRPTIKRGTFREMANKNKNARNEQIRQANIRLFIIMALLAALFWFLVS